MQLVRIFFLWATVVLLGIFIQPLSGNAAADKASSLLKSLPVKRRSTTSCFKRVAKAHHPTRFYLVPPPPAYMPSILPEYKTALSTAQSVNPYRRYIYCRYGWEDPIPRRPNKYVTYWRSKS